MYRNLIRNINLKFLHNKFERQVLSYGFEKLLINHPTEAPTFVYYRRLTDSAIQKNTTKINQNPFEIDEYITPYAEFNKKNVKYDIINILRHTFRIPENHISKLIENEKFKYWYDVKKVLEMLNQKGVSQHSILKNTWLLKNSSSLLEAKFETLNALQVNDINDFIPLLRHSAPRLVKIVQHLQNESKLIPGSRNRLYYISHKLNLEPIEVCNYLSKRLFILEMPFEMLQENLNHMIEYGVAPLSILKDLWAFRYTPKSVKARLKRAKDAKKDKIMPWMVRCPERVLEKSLKLSLDEIEILGENDTVIDYIAKRLDIDYETINVILRNHQQVLTVRVTKIKEILDYLLNDEGFSKYDIARVPRVLCHGLETTKTRLEELKSIDCRPTSLVILCKSRREYEKFVKKWVENREKIKQKEIAS